MSSEIEHSISWVPHCIVTFSRVKLTFLPLSHSRKMLAIFCSFSLSYWVSPPAWFWHGILDAKCKQIMAYCYEHMADFAYVVHGKWWTLVNWRRFTQGISEGSCVLDVIAQLKCLLHITSFWRQKGSLPCVFVFTDVKHKHGLCNVFPSLSKMESDIRYPYRISNLFHMNGVG